MGRDLGLESWLRGWLIAGLLRRKRCLRRFRLSPLTTLLEFVPSLFCSVELDFLNLVIYWQSGTAIAAESHFPIHVDFKPSAAAWAGKVDDLHEDPFRITSTNASRKTGIISAAASSRFAMPTILSTRLMNVPTIRCVRPLWISVLHAVHATGPRLRQFHHQERWRLQWKTCSPS